MSSLLLMAGEFPSAKDGDAIAAAETPVMDAFSKNAEGYTELGPPL
jgi:hypothetical protein